MASRNPRVVSVEECHATLFPADDGETRESGAAAGQDIDSDVDLWDASPDASFSVCDSSHDVLSADIGDVATPVVSPETALLNDDVADNPPYVGDVLAELAAVDENEAVEYENIVISHKCSHDVDMDALDDGLWTTRNDANPPPQFTATPGLVTAPPDDAGLSYFVRLFLFDDIFEHLVTQTNLYAQQKIAGRILRLNSFENQWEPVTRSEMKKFIALFFLTGLLRKSSIRDYWSTDFLLSTPVFPAVMSRNRFEAIQHFLHFADNVTADTADKLYKLRPFFDMITAKFRDVYVPQKQISVDEELVKFRGRVSFRQFIPSKRARFGIKVFALCDRDGYFWNSVVYVGKFPDTLPFTQELGVTGAIVLHLLDNLAGRGFQLFLDNFYTSLPLAAHLLTVNTGVCGTLRANRRGIPDELKASRVPKGEYAFRRQGKTQIVKLHDKKIVHLLTTMHNADIVPTRKRTRTGEVVHRLSLNHDYNSFMGGVDKNDAMVSAHSALRRNSKWYVKLGLHYMEEALQNAYVVYRQNTAATASHAVFIKDAVRCLLEDAGFEEGAIDHASLRLSGNHWLDENPPRGGKAHGGRKCVVCHAKGVRKESIYHCKTCSNHPALCAVPCNELYHSKQNYAA